MRTNNVAEMKAAMNHRHNGEFCLVCPNADCCTCQQCGRRVCGYAAAWIDGKGNVCANCLVTS